MKTKEQKAKIEPAKTKLGNTWSRLMTWVGGATALIGLFATVNGWVGRIEHRREVVDEYQGKMALGAVQAEQGNYAASLQTYGEILKENPSYEPAFDMQLKTAELWAEKIDVEMATAAGEAASEAARLKAGGNAETAREDDDAIGGLGQHEDADVAAAAMLDEIMPVLEVGLTRTKGPQAAGARAHIGWVHWLNYYLAERESLAAYEPNERAALALDSGNVYANAMMGHAMLVNNENLTEAMHHFGTALATGKETDFVRLLELDGLSRTKERGRRGQLVQVLNEMRKAGQRIDDHHFRWSILDDCFNPGQIDHDELVESLTAVPADEAMQTYLWLDDGQMGMDQRTEREFLQANLQELSGDKAGSLQKFEALEKELEHTSGGTKDQVDEAIARLSPAPVNAQ
jgi:tetratricopeptide (TPR) repeat protein